MKSLEVKIAYLDEDFKIVDRNKEFYTYFEKVGFLYSTIDDLVHPSQKTEFLDFVKKNHQKDEFRAYQFKKCTGEFCNNIVSVSTDPLNGKSYVSLRIIDTSHAFWFYNESVAYEQKMNHVLSLTNEYFFSYQKSTNIFRMHNFIQNRNTVVYDQDFDLWQNQMISDGMIGEADIPVFRKKNAELKECNERFSAMFECKFRTENAMLEKLSFVAARCVIGGEVFMVGRLMDESSNQRMDKSNELLQELKIDALTGVYNKKAVLNFAETRFIEGTKENAVLAIVDLDHFKPVNDAYGHLAGDKVLETAGEVLRKIVGESGIIGRYGGDEFLLILEDMNEESVFRGILRTINTDMRVAFENMFSDIKVTVSIGASQYPKDGKSFDELFKKADFCLYRAKDKGRDRYVFFRDDLHGELYKKASASKTEGIKYDVREVLELKSMADFLLSLGTEPKSAISTVLAHMLKTYNLGAINIYYGEAMERQYCVGHKAEKLAHARYVFSDEFKNALAGQAFIRVDFTTELKENAVPFGKILDGRGVKSSIQCVLGTLEQPLGLITFDRLKEAAMWAEYEMNCCIMLAAALNLLPEARLRTIFV